MEGREEDDHGGFGGEVADGGEEDLVEEEAAGYTDDDAGNAAEGADDCGFGKEDFADVVAGGAKCAVEADVVFSFVDGGEKGAGDGESGDEQDDEADGAEAQGEDQEVFGDALDFIECGYGVESEFFDFLADWLHVFGAVHDYMQAQVTIIIVEVFGFVHGADGLEREGDAHEGDLVRKADEFCRYGRGGFAKLREESGFVGQNGDVDAAQVVALENGQAAGGGDCEIININDFFGEERGVGRLGVVPAFPGSGVVVFDVIVGYSKNHAVGLQALAQPVDAQRGNIVEDHFRVDILHVVDGADFLQVDRRDFGFSVVEGENFEYAFAAGLGLDC